MDILQQIVAYKRTEVSLRMVHYPESKLENSPFYVRKCFSLKEQLRKAGESQIIAEFKRQSPSKGIINNKAGAVETTRAYAQAGASGISILTDKKFFGGSIQDIEITRQDINIPLLRKDFILTTYQITEAKAAGADVILLIAAILSASQIAELSLFAKELGMEVICEIHNESELERALQTNIDIVGVNNRNLKNFEVSIENAARLAEKIPQSFLKIAESGLQSVEDIIRLRELGYKGFLMGEIFMKEANPAQALKQFVEQLAMKMPATPTTPNTNETPLPSSEGNNEE
ncbi:MAG: indole-3-glycerol phosphate synthase TrpC [Raineya sp.]